MEGVKTLFISFLFLLSFAGNDWDAFWVLGGKNFAMQKEREKGEEKRAFSIPAPFLPLEGDPPSLRRVKRYEISLYGGGGASLTVNFKRRRVSRTSSRLIESFFHAP